LAHDDLGVGGGGGEMVEKDEAVNPGHCLVSNRQNHQANPHQTRFAVYAGFVLINRSNQDKKTSGGLRLSWTSETDKPSSVPGQ
jgi:hypothetical protein